jgi:excinuclease ABC subunit C
MQATKEILKCKIRSLPSKPGVYMFKDKNDSLLYIGKSKRIKSRVSSYFHNSKTRDERIERMITKIDDLEIIVTDFETEAIILERKLIKKYQPRYNKRSKTIRTYPFIGITNDERPRIFITRTIQNDGSAYYGPYASGRRLRRMLTVFREYFGLCTCAISLKNVNGTHNLCSWYSCFNHLLGNCSADWPLESYRKTANKMECVLSGKNQRIIKYLKQQMNSASDKLDFEQAARLRDRYQIVKSCNKQIKVLHATKNKVDIFALFIDDNKKAGGFLVFKIRNGKFVGKDSKIVKKISHQKSAEILQNLIKKYYNAFSLFDNKQLPDEIYTSEKLFNEAQLMRNLGKKIDLAAPRNGKKGMLIRMALSNAQLLLKFHKIEKRQEVQNIKELNFFS